MERLDGINGPGIGSIAPQTNDAVQTLHFKLHQELYYINIFFAYKESVCSIRRAQSPLAIVPSLCASNSSHTIRNSSRIPYFGCKYKALFFFHLPHVFIDGTPWRADDLLCSFRSMYGCGRHVVHTTPVVRIFLNLYLNNSS